LEAGVKVTSKFIPLPLFSSKIEWIVNRFWKRFTEIANGGSPLHHGFEGVFVLGFGVVFDVELRQGVGAEMGDV